MQEAVEHLEKEDDFVAETYFANHPNPEISRLAGLPTGDQEVSTASLQMKIEVQQEFARNPTNRELLQEFMKLKQMNTLLASQANNIFN